MLRIINIIKDGDTTVGATINLDGSIRRVKSETLKDWKNSGYENPTNAIITKDGFVRAKSGSLPVVSKQTAFNLSTPAQKDTRDAAKLYGGRVVTLYHGNKDKDMRPRYGVGTSNNDYGRGFYLTPDIELAREWSYNQYQREAGVGYVHTYSLDMSNLKVFDFTHESVLSWVAELLFYRRSKNDVGLYNDDPVKLFIKKYKKRTESYDVVIGYRADDSYYNFLRYFVDSGITVPSLDKCLREGDLGLQVCIKSAKAFNALNFVSVESVGLKYKGLAVKRSDNAKNRCNEIKRQDFYSKEKRFRDIVSEIIGQGNLHSENIDDIIKEILNEK